MIAMIGTSDRPCWLAETCKILLLLLHGACACTGQQQPCLQHDQPAVDLGENVSYTPVQNLPADRSVAARHFSIQC